MLRPDSNILLEANLDPTVINGGVINSFKNTAKLGQGEWAVIESDESDGSFLQLPVTYSIITNLDKEHLVEKSSLLYKCGWSPFEGTTFKGSVERTLLNGQWAYKDGEVQSVSAAKALIFDR